jgi:hypothetical protein
MTDRYDKKEHNKWHIQLKKYFHGLQGDIPFCERCNSTKPPIDIAHSRKRFDIRSRRAYFHAAMLCRKCHNDIELSATHQEMYESICLIRDEGANCPENS